jgi:hypothetical protein
MPDPVAAPAAAAASPVETGSQEEIAEGAGPAAASIANSTDPDAALAAEEGDKPKAPARRKVKVADREIELDEDVASLFEERDQVYQKRKEHTRAANERFEKAAQVFKQIEGIPQEALEALRSGDPFAVAKALGHDPDALVTDYAKKKLAEIEMSPEQRAQAQREADFNKRQADLEAREQKIQQENHQREVQRVQEDFRTNLPKVLEKFNLPDDEYVASDIGRTLAQQIRSGRQPDYEEAAEVQAERFEANLGKYLDRLSRTPGALAKKFPEIAKRLREEDVASVTAPRAIRPPSPKNAPPAPQSRPKTYAEEEREAKDRFYASLSR